MGDIDGGFDSTVCRFGCWKDGGDRMGDAAAWGVCCGGCWTVVVAALGVDNPGADWFFNVIEVTEEYASELVASDTKDSEPDIKDSEVVRAGVEGLFKELMAFIQADSGEAGVTSKTGCNL
jgi:hypothetical protein